LNTSLRTAGIVASILVGAFALTACTSADAEPAPVVVTPIPYTPPAPITPTPKPTPSPEPVVTPEPEPTPEPKPVTYETVSDREFAKIVRDPDGHIGEGYVIYGEVAQYDSATGLDALRAYVSNGPEGDSYILDGENAYLSGDSDTFEDLIEDDTFKAKVIVTGSYSYATQSGGGTTVPEFEVTSITRTGSNA